MFSTPLTCCSIGVATVWATTWRWRRGRCNRPGPSAGEIGGYIAIGRVKSAIPPARVITIDRTAAKIGRSMKKREIKAEPPGGSRVTDPTRGRLAMPDAAGPAGSRGRIPSRRSFGAAGGGGRRRAGVGGVRGRDRGGGRGRGGHRFLVGGTGLTTSPGLTRWRPLMMTFSSPLRPSVTTRRPLFSEPTLIGWAKRRPQRASACRSSGR